MSATPKMTAFVVPFVVLSGSSTLRQTVENAAALDVYLAATPPVGVFADHPHPLPAQALFELFRPLTPRLYSIASSQAESEDEVHLTVGMLRYTHHGQAYSGAASGLNRILSGP